MCPGTPILPILAAHVTGLGRAHGKKKPAVRRIAPQGRHGPTSSTRRESRGYVFTLSNPHETVGGQDGGEGLDGADGHIGSASGACYVPSTYAGVRWPAGWTSGTAASRGGKRVGALLRFDGPPFFDVTGLEGIGAPTLT